jgi:hypothetical protein
MRVRLSHLDHGRDLAVCSRPLMPPVFVMLQTPAVKVDDHRDYHYHSNDDYYVSVFLRPFENSHSWPPFHGDGDPVEMKIELEKSEAAK